MKFYSKYGVSKKSLLITITGFLLIAVLLQLIKNAQV
jgi:hypothetical protein